jgi:mannose-6-phosphate isomerase-like protein (cupin superfamily)
MKGYVVNLEQKTQSNSNFRQVLFTTPNSQLVLMALQPNEEIGTETHMEHDQFIRVESGRGKVIMDGEETEISDGFGFVIPAGVEHNVVNTSGEVMKLYTIYTPPEHADGTVHQTKAEAEADDHHH